MLMPKKVKYRKQQRGRMRGKAWRGMARQGKGSEAARDSSRGAVVLGDGFQPALMLQAWPSTHASGALCANTSST